MRVKTKTIKVDNEVLIVDEVSTARDVSQWKLIRDRGQISEEILCLCRYYKEIFMSNDKLFGNTRYCISQWLVKCEDSLPEASLAFRSILLLI